MARGGLARADGVNVVAWLVAPGMTASRCDRRRQVHAAESASRAASAAPPDGGQHRGRRCWSVGQRRRSQRSAPGAAARLLPKHLSWQVRDRHDAA
jgi:hypothetical protein